MQRVDEWVWTRLQATWKTIRKGPMQRGKQVAEGRAPEKDCDGLDFSSALPYSALFVAYNSPLICRECMQFQLEPKLPARWCNKCASFIYGWIPLPAEAYNNKHPSHIFPSKPQNSRFHLYIPQTRGKAPGQPSVYLRIREAATTTWHQPSARLAKQLLQTHKTRAQKACF